MFSAIALVLAALALLLALAWWLRCQASALAAGQLQRQPPLQRQDELGLLDQVVQSVEGVIQALQDRDKAHAWGRAPATRAVALPWSPGRCIPWPSARPMRHGRSAA